MGKASRLYMKAIRSNRAQGSIFDHALVDLGCSHFQVSYALVEIISQGLVDMQRGKANAASHIGKSS
jgi:hypothetical protein